MNPNPLDDLARANQSARRHAPVVFKRSNSPFAIAFMATLGVLTAISLFFLAHFVFGLTIGAVSSPSDEAERQALIQAEREHQQRMREHEANLRETQRQIDAAKSQR